MKKRLLLVSLLALAGITMSGCNKDNTNPDHVHTFATEWSHDESKHWHAATCGHDVKDKEGNHIDSNTDGKCDVCDTPIIVEKTELIEGKKLYALGEDFDEDGFKIVATMTDETEKKLDYTVSGYDKNKLGNQIVTLTFTKNGQKDTLTVELVKRYYGLKLAKEVANDVLKKAVEDQDYKVLGIE